MKTARFILLSVAIFFTGCYTQSPITRVKSAPGDQKVFFYLKDGSYIESFAGKHQRVEGGYQVSGTILKRGNNPVEFDGLVLDNDIDRLGIVEIGMGETVLALGGVTLFVSVLLLAEGLSSWK